MENSVMSPHGEGNNAKGGEGGLGFAFQGIYKDSFE